MSQRTLLILIEADQNELEVRKRQRDGLEFNANEYDKRTEQELATLRQYRHHFKHIITNSDGKLNVTIQNIIDLYKNLLLD